jgi:hypothetical protein
VIKLGGPEALSPLEVLRIFESAQGREFAVQLVPEEALRGQKESSNDPLQQSFAGLMLYYCAGDVIDMRETLQNFPCGLRPSETMPKPPRSLSHTKTEHEVQPHRIPTIERFDGEMIVPRVKITLMQIDRNVRTDL